MKRTIRTLAALLAAALLLAPAAAVDLPGDLAEYGDLPAE